MAQPEQLVSRTIEPGVVARIADGAHRRCRVGDSPAAGRLVPELAGVELDSFDVCPATAEGRFYGAGPATRDRAITAAVVEQVLSVMTASRVYNATELERLAAEHHTDQRGAITGPRGGHSTV
ncbi:hypothetical protein AB0M45_19325 [Nocardia sp. NPDC051787]|uniref:hypothetical protein n=1 Tax=Nocardia sp. NPDC051787 TaxID=3155415 RepID=UPI00344752D6